MAPKWQSVNCWIMTASVSVAVFAGMMGKSPNETHRMLLAGFLAFLVVLNAWMWSMLHRPNQHPAT